jgi:hypothetical protein
MTAKSIFQCRKNAAEGILSGKTTPAPLPLAILRGNR